MEFNISDLGGYQRKAFMPIDPIVYFNDKIMTMEFKIKYFDSGVEHKSAAYQPYTVQLTADGKLYVDANGDYVNPTSWKYYDYNGNLLVDSAKEIDYTKTVFGQSENIYYASDDSIVYQGAEMVDSTLTDITYPDGSVNEFDYYQNMKPSDFGLTDPTLIDLNTAIYTAIVTKADSLDRFN